MSKEYATRIGTFLPTQQDLDDFAKGSLTLRLLQTFNRMTIWFKLFHDLRTNHEPSVLIAAAHSKVVEIWILVPLGLLHSSYTALRTIVDICTSYTFYYSHPMEWRSVCDNQADWESRAAIIEWHLHFTPGFRELQRSLGLRGCLISWGPGQTAQHESGHGGVDPSLRSFRQTLIILAQTPLQVQPTEGAFHHPAPGQYLEST